jgi:glycosyltransferase involved in cell wall biosynthesis
MIIEGYLKTEKKYPLVIVGNTNTKHSQDLVKYKNDNIHFLGGIYEREKLMIFRAASLTYFHGHSVGGTNPSLLEAMGSKNFCICHDNIFNREVVQENGKYFKNKDEANDTFIFAEEEKNNALINLYKDGVFYRAINYYSWENIAKKYLAFSQKIKPN